MRHALQRKRQLTGAKFGKKKMPIIEHCEICFP